MKTLTNLSLGLMLILTSGCKQSPYVHIDGPRIGDVGYLVKSNLYQPWFAEEGYTGWGGGRLYLTDRAGLTNAPLWNAVWHLDGKDYIVLMRWAGASLGVSEALLIDVYDTRFRHVRSGVANGPTGSEPYALVMAKMRTPHLPAEMQDRWLLCIAFSNGIDEAKPIRVSHYDNTNESDNDAILEVVEWDDEAFKLKRGTGEISDLTSFELRSAEHGLEIRPDGYVVVPPPSRNGGGL